MKRASFTIQLKSGIAYDANHICATYEDGTGAAMVSFISSGRMQSVLAEEVESVEFRGVTGQHCSECEHSLLSLSTPENP